MSNFKVGKSRFSRFINGKGFYIALALCLVAIGSAAYIAANNSFGMFSNLSSSSQSSANSDAQSSLDWESDSQTQQTGNTVSGVAADSSSSTASASSSSAASKTTSSSTSSAAPTLYILPVEGNIVTDYSSDSPVYDKTMNDWRVHDAVDISGDEGTPVKACADGVVSDVKVDDLLGQQVIIQHGGGIVSIYSNLTNQVSVKKGQTVQAGTVIGAIGETAQGEISLVPHLHFAMMKNNQYVNPLTTMGKKK